MTVVDVSALIDTHADRTRLTTAETYARFDAMTAGTAPCSCDSADALQVLATMAELVAERNRP